MAKKWRLVATFSQNDDSYRIWDWFESEGECLDRTYETRTEALAAGEVAYKGPDVDGVELTFDAEEVDDPEPSLEEIRIDFPAWYARMGYHRHGGQKACAEAIGTTPRMVRYLMEGKREPSNTLVKLCQLMECKK